MAEPLDTSAIQQKMDVLTKWIWQKETDPTASAKNSFINNSSRSWSTDLPPLVLEEIYLLLNRRDQCQMSMVCKNWAKEYKSPSIWRDFTFVVPSTHCSLDVCPEVRIAQRFGEMFRHVKILSETPKFLQDKNSPDQLFLFLEALTCRSQLLSFHIEIDFSNLTLKQEIYENTFRSFLRFLQSQNNMKIIKFINTHLEKSKYVQILEELIIKKPATLKQLHVIGIDKFSRGKIPDLSQNARGIYDMLLNVEQLFIDYSQTFERLILCLKYAIESDKLPLRRKPIYINLYSNCFEDSCRGIEYLTWKILSKHWPTLKVGLCYTASGISLFDLLMLCPLEKIIVKNMPLATFKCDLGREERPHINDVFRHLTLTGVCNFLEVIKITSKETKHYVQDLITLLLHCPKLEQFTVDAPLHVARLDLLFDFIAANRIKNLKYICVNICGTLSSKVLTLYTDVIEKYSINMKEMGFKITCKCCYGTEICTQIHHKSLDITCWKASVKS